MSLQHYKSELNKVSQHLIGSSVPPDNILIPFSLSSAQKKIGYHYWLVMQGSLLIEKGFKYSFFWSCTVKEFIGTKAEFQLSSLDCHLSSLSWKRKILITKNYEKKKARQNCCPLCSTEFLSIQILAALWNPNCSVLPEKKALIFHFFPDSFPSRSFHAEIQKAFDVNAGLSQEHVRGPVWRWSFAKTVISCFKSFQTTVCFYELIFLWYLL